MRLDTDHHCAFRTPIWGYPVMERRSIVHPNGRMDKHGGLGTFAPRSEGANAFRLIRLGL